MKAKQKYSFYNDKIDNKFYSTITSIIISDFDKFFIDIISKI